MKNSITHLFEDVNLYEPKELQFYSKIDEKYSRIKNEDLKNLFDYLGLLEDNKLITDCIWCNGHFPFSFNIQAMNRDREIGSIHIGKSNEGHQLYLEFKNPQYISESIFTDSIATQLITIDYYFSCTNNDEFHNYFMKLAILFSKEKVVVIKIGQFPENSSLGKFNAEEFKSELRKLDDGYIDYKNSEKSFRHGLYVGAYDYLRRVYEKMINYYISKCGVTLSDNCSAKDKIKSIKHCFDKRIQEYLYPFYQALSAGIHVMPEEECKENYAELKAIIDIQLQFIKSEEELNQQISKSKKVLNDLNKKYGNS